MFKEGAVVHNWTIAACVLCGQTREVILEKDDLIVNSGEGVASYSTGGFSLIFSGGPAPSHPGMELV